ncbi:heme-binding protein [Aquirufa sp. OSTEICH-129V]|uniref:Heme-binding protein n=1 Tax=Aquirufa avitistagni TaxID=3104728 RepID=A0ABW6DHD0_9BACT
MKAFYIIASIGFIFLMIQSYQLVSSNLKTENQKYRLVRKEAKFEIRFYPAATFAKIYSQGTNYKSVASSGFRKLAGYIFGGNDQGKSIAMTSPVRMEIGNQGSTMSFVMPEKYTSSDLPKPKDSGVHIVKSSPQYVAVIRFGGYADDEKITEKRDELLALIQKKGIKVAGEYSFLGYNAPFQFWGRKNEVVIPIEWKE